MIEKLREERQGNKSGNTGLCREALKASTPPQYNYLNSISYLVYRQILHESRERKKKSASDD